MTSAAPERDADVIVVGAGPAGATDGLPPGPVRARRPAAGEDGLPAREGLRRRPHARVRSSSWSPSASTRAPSTAGCATRACASSAASTPRAEVARAVVVPRLRPGPAAPGLRRRAGAPGRQGRRPPARAHQRRGARCSTRGPAGSSASPRAGSRTTAPRGRRPRTGRTLVIAADGNSTRLSLAMGLRKRDDRPDGRRRAHLLPQPTARRRLAGVVARALGRHRARPQAAARATAGSSVWATERSTSGSGSSTPAQPSGTWTTRTSSSAGSTRRPRSGASATRT